MRVDLIKATGHTDALVAQRVLNWPLVHSDRENPDAAFLVPPTTEPDPWWRYASRDVAENDWRIGVRFYSDTISDAWTVVDKMHARGYCLSLTVNRRGRWSAKFGRSNTWRVVADTAPLAICRAALLAVGAAERLQA